MSFEQMTSRLAIMMGGRIAEEMTFGHDKVTSGAQSDIEQATRLARMMVTRWGFSPELGTVAYGENQDEVFSRYVGRPPARTYRRRRRKPSIPRFAGSWKADSTMHAGS
jgi:ATP-dependent Zn protease